MFSSSDDDKDIQESARILQETAIGIEHTSFKNHGHFTYSGMGKREFPELLKIALK